MKYQPVMELGGSAKQNFDRYNEMQHLVDSLPGLDCGGCGAPTCLALAEDIVRGNGSLDDCIVLMRKKMEGVLQALDLGGTKKTPRGKQHPKKEKTGNDL